MIVVFTCEQCQATVRKRRGPANTPTAPRFCSQRCHGLARAGTGDGPSVTHRYTCEACGKDVQVHRTPSAPTPRFCSVQCTGAGQRGRGNPSWSGGWHFDAAGYVLVLAPDHPAADVRGYVLEHRLVAEQREGRPLIAEEVIHHLNGVKDDNRPENLLVMPNQAAHARLHRLAGVSS